MGYRMDNVFIKKMCIEKATDKYDNQFVLKKVVFGTNNQLLVNGQYRDLAYDLYNKTGVVFRVLDMTDREIVINCDEIFNSLMSLRNERINVTVSESGCVLEGIELSNE